MRIVEYRGKWCAVAVIDGKRRRLSLGNLVATAENYPSAQRALVDLERQLAQPRGDTVEAIMTAYLADTKAVTADYMNWMWGVLKPFCAGLRPDQIDRKWCRDYAVKRGKAPGTIRKEIGLLAAALRWAGKTSAVIELPPQPPPRDRWLTEGEFLRLLAAAQSHPHLTMFLHLAIATGARKEAILELTWPQVHWDSGQIWLGRKAGGKARAIVPMTKTIRPILQSAQAVAQTDHVIEYAGRPVTDIKRAFATACKAAGLKNVTPHDLRHTAAVWMAAAGISMAKIAQYLGHSDSQITERVYARFAPDHLRDAADALELD